LIGLFLLSVGTAQAQSDRGGGYYSRYAADSCAGVIKNYDDPTAKSIIQSDLQNMYNQGQRKVTVQVYHVRGAGNCGVPGLNGWPMDSDLNNFDWQYIANLETYLIDAKAIGFNQVQLIMSPAEVNWPRSWPNFEWGVNNLYYYENWFTLYFVRQAAVNADMPFIIILADEPFVPYTYSQAMTAYVHDIWQLYLQTFGAAQGRNEAGFTIGGINTGNQTTTPASQVNQLIAEIDHVGLGRPTYWPLTMFKFDANPQERTNANWSGFIEVHNTLAARGAFDPIVVASTFYNDWSSAYGLRAASGYTGRPISFLMQWPLSAPPMVWYEAVPDFYNYIDFGF
jgi:hypothetical protein